MEMLIAPELIKIFATDDYLDAIYVIPPVAMSIYFIFLYVVFANVEFYFEKTIFATIVSGIAAVMNIGMNYIFLKKIWLLCCWVYYFDLLYVVCIIALLEL
ncbi:MAG: hypothetical protein ACLR8A_07610 [Bacteroides caccae]